MRCIDRGFTLVEVLVVISVISALGAVGYVTTAGVRETAAEAKLQSDVATLNRAIDLYRANGGVIPADAGADSVLAKLKTQASAATAAVNPGMNGNFVDVRIEAVAQSNDEAATSALRAVWDSSAMAFVTTRSSSGGIKEFRLNDDLASADTSTEDRNVVLQGATESKWVWDYVAASPTPLSSGVSPSASSASPVTGSVGAGGGGSPLVTKLSMPLISPAGGVYPLASFPLSVTISDPNTSGASILYYSTTGTYSVYSGPITVTPGTSVSAIAVSLDVTRYSNSDTATASYSLEPYPEGALVGAADVNGTFVGSLIYSNAAGNFPKVINFNAGAKIIAGNLYFPGTPTIDVKPGATIQGRVFDDDGTETPSDAAEQAKKIVDLSGSVDPSNYTVRINNNVLIEGKVFRRATPPPFPEVTLPTGLTSYSGFNMNSGAPPMTLAPGSYGSINTSNGSVLILGVEGATTPSRYVFDGININGASELRVVGPVELTMKSNMTVNGGSIVGNSEHPEWLKLFMFSGNFQVNGNGSAYAQVVAPNSTVGLDGTFNGSVTAKFLRINGNGVFFTIAPVIGNQ